MVTMKIHPDDIGLKFPRYIKSKGKTPKKAKSSHDEIQIAAESYCNERGIAFVHIPDELLKFIFAPFLGQALQKNRSLYGWLQRVRCDISNYLLGVPDLILLKPTLGWNLSVAVEFKTGAGKQRKGQIKFAEKVNTIVCRDIEHFKKIADEFVES